MKRIPGTNKRTQILLGFLLVWMGCSSPRDIIIISGQTMGTTYSIKIIHVGLFEAQKKIEQGIDSILTEVNRKMSTWDPNSEISLFNQNQTDSPIPVSPEFFQVVNMAQAISRKTNGAFDVTVFDLMSLWGFGPNPKSGMPTHEEIENVLSHSGWEKIILSDNGIQKQNPKTKLDLNAIAKGYGVDEVFQFLQLKGCTDLFVEIGGEVQCSGRNQRNKYWSIGIENPSGGNKSNQIFAAIVYSDGGAVATSGNYRNFVDVNGEILGHIINPKTGFPLQTNVLSVTVLSNSCMVADAWATALMVMDYETGLKKVTENPDIKAVWILDKKDGSRRVARSVGAKIDDSIYEIIR
jgi:thiamine biosynthesis lipoprotein